MNQITDRTNQTWPTPAEPLTFLGWTIGRWARWAGVLAAVGFLFGIAATDPQLFAGIVIVGIVGTGYFFPTIVAGGRHHHNTGAIAVVNIFLGWTFIGWVVALAMAASAVRSADAR